MVPSFTPRRPTQVIAHRGASVAAPENTLDAFRLARRMGADAVELDVRRTADDVLIVHHDARLADGTAIVDLGRSELPASIPDLTTALDACEQMWVNVEIKNDPNDPDMDPDRTLAPRVASVLRSYDADDRWVVSSFDLEMVDRVACSAPGLPTAWLVLEIGAETLDRVCDAGHVAVHPWVGLLTEPQVRECHRRDLAVNTWTCNDAARLRELVSWGVDGVCTDVPDLGRSVVGPR